MSDLAWRHGRGVLDFQPTVTTAGTGKPPHRIRNTYNFIRPIIEAKISAATQRIPILDLPLPTPPPEGAQWIEAYRRWAKGA